MKRPAEGRIQSEQVFLRRSPFRLDTEGVKTDLFHVGNTEKGIRDLQVHAVAAIGRKYFRRESPFKEFERGAFSVVINGGEKHRAVRCDLDLEITGRIVTRAYEHFGNVALI